MPSRKAKSKRKLNKGTEKLSPEEKRVKSITKHFKMATSLQHNQEDILEGKISGKKVILSNA